MGNKILIITYYWPPSGGVGVQRWMNFSIQLKNQGYEPIILTPENPQFSIKDNALLEKVANIKVYKAPIWEPFDFFHKLTGNINKKNVKQGLVLEKEQKSLIDELSVWIRGNLMLPDPRVFWLKNATQKAKEIISEEKIDQVITTGPPHSMHLIGRNLKRDLGIFWLADFRDPWSKWDILQKLKTSWLALEYHKRQEESVLKNANVVTTVSKRLAESFGNAQVLHNGISLSENASVDVSKDEFVIGYFGMLNELRNPQQLWLLLDQLCRENEAFYKKLKVRIGGIVADTIKKEISELQFLSEKVEYLGYLAHQEVQEAYKKCNLLLLLLNRSDNSKWILPVKFFEYLTANRMILALGPRNSDLGSIMNGKDVGELLEYHDIEHIRLIILNNFEQPTTPDQKDVDMLIKSFSHESLVHKLIEFLNLSNA